MRIDQIRRFLEDASRGSPSLDPCFRFDRYHRERDDYEVEMFATNPRYIDTLARCFAKFRPTTMLTIGALYGTTESYFLQCCGGRETLRELTIVDLDMADYNAERDNGSLIYRNICGTSQGAMDGTFIHIRGDSAWDGVKKRVRAGATYDLIFVDGEHTEKALVSDMDLAAETLSPGGVIFAHDTSLHSSGVPAGWHRWCSSHPEFWCDAVSGDVFPFGLGFAKRH